MPDRMQLSIRDIGRWLELRRSNNIQTVLVLGSRAGGLYRSEPFYTYCQPFVVPHFSTRPLLWSFRECYIALTRQQLSERELHTLLQDSLRNVGSLLNVSDLYCAEIIKRGYFREVISTNMDDIMERAMLSVELVEDKDFQVCIPGKAPLSPQRELPYRLTKVFGDVLSRQYALYNRQTYLIYEKVECSLQSILSGDVLAVGLDPLWDRSLLPFLQQQPRSLWFVNEEEDILFDQQISPMLHQAQTATVVDQNHDYDTLWRQLYHYLCRDSDSLQEKVRYSWNTSASRTFERRHDHSFSSHRSLLSDLPPNQENSTIRVLYLYCDHDLPLMQKIWQHLQILKNSQMITEWHRADLSPGDDYQLEQERELRRAHLILVGFSTQFVTSEYCAQARQALELSLGGSVTLVPLLLRPVGNWKQTPFSAIYALPRGEKTLSELSAKDLEKALSKMADDIHDLVLHLRSRIIPPGARSQHTADPG
jgi:hypothetical protein